MECSEEWEYGYRPGLAPARRPVVLQSSQLNGQEIQSREMYFRDLTSDPHCTSEQSATRRRLSGMNQRATRSGKRSDWIMTVFAALTFFVAPTEFDII